MERAVLHVDCNKFYASVECLYRPEIRHLPVAVCGDAEQRRGIVLTKNEIAAKYHIKTGEAVWQARRKCPGLVCVPPDFPLYMRFSAMVRQILSDYTDLIEPFGLDESWLDVSGSGNIGSGAFIAEEIRRRVKFELGITVSVGVSFNKIFAKLGSDYKKPDAVTIFTKDNFRSLVWPLPACELLYVGPATSKKLKSCGIGTIGDLAAAPPEYLHMLFGKMGYVLFRFANGLDNEPVAPAGSAPVIKSIGNSSTAPRDLENEGDVKIMILVLAESVGRRMREQGFRCSTVSISFRDNLLNGTVRQRKLERFTADSDEIARAGMELFRGSWDWRLPLRSVGISCSGFEHESSPFQLDLFDDGERRLRRERLEKTVDSLKARFGNGCVQRAVLIGDKKLSGFNPYNDHVIHPVAYFKP